MSDIEIEHLALRALPDDERPRERLLTHGAGQLSNSELLAILLRTGTAQENVLQLASRILAQFNGVHGLTQATPASLRQIRGIGDAKIAQLLAALELGKRASDRKTSSRPTIQNAEEAAYLLRDMSELRQEHVRVILLDSRREVISVQTVYIGTLNASVIRAAEIFRDAIAHNSPAIVLAHNHPSGDCTPSPEDIVMTRQIHAAGQLLDITLVDHLIIGAHDWVSLRTMGLGFN